MGVNKNYYYFNILIQIWKYVNSIKRGQVIHDDTNPTQVTFEKQTHLLNIELVYKTNYQDKYDSHIS